MIIFEAVTKQFPPDDSGVIDVSFEIEPGELVLLTGPSGSGKTTLFKLLLKEYVPGSGAIQFEDTDVMSLSSGQIHDHRRKIGVVFQNYRLLPELNIWENIALPLWITGQSETEIENRVTDLLELVNLPDKAHLFPHQISGGEAQRISIARALANAPSVILADEPTGNLDEESSAGIAKLLHSINDLGTTIVFATHDPKVLSLLADRRRLHMKNGKLVLDTYKKDTKADKSAKKQQNEDKSDKKTTEKLKNDSKDTKNSEKADLKDKKSTDSDKNDLKSKKIDQNSKSSKRSEENLDDEDLDDDDQNIEDADDTQDEKPTKKSGFFQNLFSKKAKKTEEAD